MGDRRLPTYPPVRSQVIPGPPLRVARRLLRAGTLAWAWRSKISLGTPAMRLLHSDSNLKGWLPAGFGGWWWRLVLAPVICIVGDVDVALERPPHCDSMLFACMILITPKLAAERDRPFDSSSSPGGISLRTHNRGMPGASFPSPYPRETNAQETAGRVRSKRRQGPGESPIDSSLNSLSSCGEGTRATATTPEPPSPQDLAAAETEAGICPCSGNNCLGFPCRVGLVVEARRISTFLGLVDGRSSRPYERCKRESTPLPL